MCTLGNSGVGSSVIVGSFLISTLTHDSRAREPLGTAGAGEGGAPNASGPCLEQDPRQPCFLTSHSERVIVEVNPVVIEASQRAGLTWVEKPELLARNLSGEDRVRTAGTGLSWSWKSVWEAARR